MATIASPALVEVIEPSDTTFSAMRCSTYATAVDSIQSLSDLVSYSQGLLSERSEKMEWIETQMLIVDLRMYIYPGGVEVHLRLIPIICEADGGGWGPAAHKVWGELAKHKSILTGKQSSTVATHILQSLGLILHRENARAILRRTPKWQI